MRLGILGRTPTQRTLGQVARPGDLRAPRFKCIGGGGAEEKGSVKAGSSSNASGLSDRGRRGAGLPPLGAGARAKLGGAGDAPGGRDLAAPMGFGAGRQLGPVPGPCSAAEEAVWPGQRWRCARQGEAESAELATGGAMEAGVRGGCALAGAARCGFLALLLAVSAPRRLQAEEPGEWSAPGGRRAGPGGTERGRKSGSYLHPTEYYLHPAECCSLWPTAAREK